MYPDETDTGRPAPVRARKESEPWPLNPSRMRRAIVVAACLAAVVPGPAPAVSDAGPPLDYANRAGMSEPTAVVTRQSVSIPMRDGLALVGDVVRPVGPGPFPVIIEHSPRNGGRREGHVQGIPDEATGSRFGALTDYFPPRGYAVLLVDARGTNMSPGCADFLGPTAASDGYDIVQWVGTQAWATDRIAMIGYEEEGALALAAASVNPPKLTTVVAIAAPARAYDFRYQGGVAYHPDWFFPLGSGEQGWLRSLTDSACSGRDRFVQTAPDYLSGRYTAWDATHDYRSAAASSSVPFFTVQGFGERMRATASEWLRARGTKPGDKVWLGNWEEGPQDRGMQWVGVLHRWFDTTLQLRPLDTGPPVEVFLNPRYQVQNVNDLNDPANAFFRGKVRTASAWPTPSRSITLYPSSDHTMSFTPPEPNSDVWLPSPTGRGMWFESPIFEQDTVLTGVPEFVLDAAMSHRVDLKVTIWEVGTSLRVIAKGALNPELRDGGTNVSPVVPGVPMRLRPAIHPLDYQIHGGSFIRVFVNSNDPDKAPWFAGPAATVFSYGGPDPARFTFDIVDDVVLHTDPRP